MAQSKSTIIGDEPLTVTDGIDIKNWEVKVPNQDVTITYSIWDFAGQTVYYNTHQVEITYFTSHRITSAFEQPLVIIYFLSL